MRHIVLFAIGVTALGCAAKPRPAVIAPVAVDMAPADRLFDAGCYRCLKEAFEIYDRARTGPLALPRARDRTFATAVLLALREKELGLDATPWLERASALATPDERRYLDVAQSLPWANAGITPGLRANRAPRPNRTSRLPSHCRSGQRARDAGSVTFSSRWAAPPDAR